MNVSISMPVRAGVLVGSALISTWADAAPQMYGRDSESMPLPVTTASALASTLKVGDVVFIRVGAKPFREVARATNSWTNHVGVVVDTSGAEPTIGESRFPLSGTTQWSKFVARSERGRVSVRRIRTALTPEQYFRVSQAAENRSGILYDTGFNLHSRGEFCSRYVREVLSEATGTSIGEIESFSQLLRSNPDAKLGFWRVWYFGSIPWERQTVTPAAMLRSPALETVFDGIASPRPVQQMN